MGTTQEANLQLEAVSPEEARALHRVVRAMHDGHCPKCGDLHPSDRMHVTLSRNLADGRVLPGDITGWERLGQAIRCPSCGWYILEEEVNDALTLFHDYMRKSYEIFENWRTKRAERD